MSSISEWLDAAFIAFDNPQLKDYNAAKKLAGKKKREEEKTDLQRYFEEESKRVHAAEEENYGMKQDEEIHKWQKKQEYKRNRKKPKLSHYDRVKRRLKKKTDEKRLRMIKKLKGVK
jgi:hypothetical protein